MTVSGQMTAERAGFVGALWATAAAFCFSTNDVIVKFLSGEFPLYEIIFIRSIVGLFFLLFVIAPFQGGRSALRTKRLGIHILRGLCVVFANFCFFLGLAALPLAEAVAIFFVSPLVITVFSVVFLGEHVGPRRWAAVAAGLIGVLVVLRPGTEAFQVASLLPLLAAVGYATLHTLTRRIGATENALAMAFYIQVVFIAIAGTAGFLTADGRFEGAFEHPSLQFLLRGWVLPSLGDAALIVLLGIAASLGGLTISEAYRRSEAALVAPFEYVAMPLAVFWGLTVFGEWPDTVAWLGIALIVGAGLVLVWREAVARRRRLAAPKRL